MKVAILANTANSYVKPMAEGLQRMLSEIGVEGHILYDGLENLSRLPRPFRQYVRDSSNGSITKNTLRYFLREVPYSAAFLHKLRSFDLIIVVSSIAPAFLRSFFRDEILRAFLPKTPIVLYDVFYLPTRGMWAKWFKEGSVEHGVLTQGNWGLERYDWYLVASVVSECPLPKGPQPYSLIGLNFDDGSLRPDQKEDFVALIDFEQRGHLHERMIQILACEETKTKYIALFGHYLISKIREIYRKCSIYFLASRESFSLPICELQACGSYVFTPYSHWAPSHWLKKDLHQGGQGELSPNFIVYGDDKDNLVREIQRIKALYDPQKVVNTFHQYHPQLFYGDKAELKKFIQMVERGEIDSQTHKRNTILPACYKMWNAAIKPPEITQVSAGGVLAGGFIAENFPVEEKRSLNGQKGESMSISPPIIKQHTS